MSRGSLVRTGTGTTILQRTAAAVLMACVAAVLAGCVALPSEAAAPAAATPAPTTSPSFAAYPVPADLGAEPASDILSDSEIEALRVQYEDQAWSDLLLRFPDAVRPGVHFAGYVSETDDRVAIMTACYEPYGIPLDHGTIADGTVVSVGPSGDSEEEELAGFVCRSEHPSRPTAPLNTAQKVWVYRYLTEFLAPCYAANGIENPPPPSREDFVAKWPNQNWWPSSGNMPLDGDADAALQKACPLPE